MKYDITVKQNYAGSLSHNKKVKLYYVFDEQYDLGLIQIKSLQGRNI